MKSLSPHTLKMLTPTHMTNYPIKKYLEHVHDSGHVRQLNLIVGKKMSGVIFQQPKISGTQTISMDYGSIFVICQIFTWAMFHDMGRNHAVRHPKNASESMDIEFPLNMTEDACASLCSHFLSIHIPCNYASPAEHGSHRHCECVSFLQHITC